MRILALSFFLLLAGWASAQPREDIVAYIKAYKQLAMEEMQRTGIPAAIKLAQGIHETSAGKSQLVMKSNNHFGIKCKTYWTGKKVYHDDDARGECFRSYNEAIDSYRDHSDFLKAGERYAFLFNLDPVDYKGWATGLKKAGYATNPKYAPVLIRIIEEYNLQQYSLIALGVIHPSAEIMAESTPTINQIIPASLLLSDLAEDLAEDLAPPEASPASEPEASVAAYPTGEFMINNTRVIFARQGTTLLSIAREYDIPLQRLLDFNEIEGEEVLLKDQLVYLQRKRKTGAREFRIVGRGETLYDICQTEAIRLSSLIEYNQLQQGAEPPAGAKLYLQPSSGSRQKM